MKRLILDTKIMVVCQSACVSAGITANVLYWRRSGLIPLKLIRITNVDDTTNIHTKHETRFFANTLLCVRLIFLC